MKEYKIGEVARLLGLTTQALRFYEQEGVVMPRKSENGTRYYTTEQMVLLLSFKKYRQSGFTVQDIVAHFKDDTVDQLIGRLSEQRQTLVEQAQLLLRRAHAMERFEHMLTHTIAHAGEITAGMRPPIYLLDPPLDRLDEANDAQHQSLNAYTEAMPDTSIVFLRLPTPNAPVRFCFGASTDVASRWSLPTEHAQLLEPTRCVTMPIRGLGRPWDEAIIADLIAKVTSAGYEVDPSQSILGIHFSSETVDQVVHMCGVVWIPVR